MAVTIGKRKRAKEDDLSDGGSNSGAEIRARMKRAFEKRFQPLEEQALSSPRKTDEVQIEDEQESDESEWDGLIDDRPTVAVIEHESSGTEVTNLQSREKKHFMSSRPPMFTDSQITGAKQSAKVTADDDPAEASNLKKDLALQRLLKESHLLTPSAPSELPSEPSGKGRIKALDLRLMDLGAKKSSTEQMKMPLSHRKGISAKLADREAKRREEAAANGVVLEKARFAAKAIKPREKSIGGPKVGKYQSGTLKLNSKDVRSIQGSRLVVRGGRKGRGRP